MWTITLIYEFLLETFFPNRCIVCKKFGPLLCAECATKIEFIKTSVCPECGKISDGGKYCVRCKPKIGCKLDGIIVSAKYDRPVKELIYGLKYSGITGIAPLLGELIITKIIGNKLFDKAVLIPVPLHKKRKNKRGFNQAELVVKYISKRLELEASNRLERTKDTKPQVGQSRQKRLKNIENAFKYKGDASGIAGKTVILIDDVATTGATLRECAKSLKSAGAKKVYGAVVARNI